MIMNYTQISLILLLFTLIFNFSVALSTNVQECRTPNNELGQCIFLHECKPLEDLMTKTPLTQNDVNYLRASQCGNQQGTVLVCCAQNSINSGTSKSIQHETNNNNNCNNLPMPGVSRACGQSAENRIYGGNKTTIDEYPWMALLEYTKPGDKKGFHCGGVLINNQYVLTAAHCVNGKDIPSTWSLTGVRLGEWDVTTSPDCDLDDCADPHIDAPIEKFITHEQFNPMGKDQHNDIALLRLSRSIQFTSFISPICLPRGNNFIQPTNIEGLSMDIVGWGRTEAAKASDVKLKARLNGANFEQCKQKYNSEGILLENTQLCAGGQKNIDSCRGDSGGPMSALSSGKIPFHYVVGIVSFGATSCGLENWPGIYTNVASYISWIENKICT